MTTQHPEVLYPDRDPEDFAEDYAKHLAAMTVEGLHDKADIAEQLAWRDAELRRLHAENEALKAANRDAERYQFIRKHWKTVNFKFQKEPNIISGFTMTVSTKANNAESVYIDSEIDLAIKAAHSTKEQT